MNRRGLGLLSAALATVGGLQLAGQEVGASGDGVAIELDDDSRFSFAVAGTIQLPTDQSSGSSGEATSTTVARGTTVILPDTTTTPTTTATPATFATMPTVNVTIRNGTTAYGRRGLVALGALGFAWQSALDGWTIDFQPGRATQSGLTNFSQRTITIYVRDSHSASKLAHVVAHEIGHVVDWRFVTDAERDEWRAARGLGSGSWYPSGGTFDFASPAGDFAEAFAEWQVGGGNYSQLGGPVTSDQIDVLSRIVGPG